MFIAIVRYPLGVSGGSLSTATSAGVHYISAVKTAGAARRITIASAPITACISDANAAAIAVPTASAASV